MILFYEYTRVTRIFRVIHTEIMSGSIKHYFRCELEKVVRDYHFNCYSWCLQSSPFNVFLYS